MFFGLYRALTRLLSVTQGALTMAHIEDGHKILEGCFEKLGVLFWVSLCEGSCYSWYILGAANI